MFDLLTGIHEQLRSTQDFGLHQPRAAASSALDQRAEVVNGWTQPSFRGRECEICKCRGRHRRCLLTQNTYTCIHAFIHNVICIILILFISYIVILYDACIDLQYHNNICVMLL